MTKLDIISDPICPWCYIGKTKLDRALADHPDHGFEIEWHPFQLNPHMDPEGAELRAYLEAKFGGKEAADRIYGQIAGAAKDAGLDNVDLDKITRTPSTIDAHRLIHWAGLEGRQDGVVNRLFTAYFELGLDISNHVVLADIAEAAKLDRAVVERLLAGDSDREEIVKRDTHARERGVQGVPCFIVAEQYVMNGAQPPELWAQVIADLAAQSVEDATLDG